MTELISKCRTLKFKSDSERERERTLQRTLTNITTATGPKQITSVKAEIIIADNIVRTIQFFHLKRHTTTICRECTLDNISIALKQHTTR